MCRHPGAAGSRGWVLPLKSLPTAVYQPGPTGELRRHLLANGGGGSGGTGPPGGVGTSGSGSTISNGGSGIGGRGVAGVAGVAGSISGPTSMDVIIHRDEQPYTVGRSDAGHLYIKPALDVADAVAAAAVIVANPVAIDAAVSAVVDRTGAGGGDNGNGVGVGGVDGYSQGSITSVTTDDSSNANDVSSDVGEATFAVGLVKTLSPPLIVGPVTTLSPPLIFGPVKTLSPPSPSHLLRVVLIP